MSVSFMLKYTLGVDRKAIFLPWVQHSLTRKSMVALEYQYWLRSPFSLFLTRNAFFLGSILFKFLILEQKPYLITSNYLLLPLL